MCELCEPGIRWLLDQVAEQTPTYTYPMQRYVWEHELTQITDQWTQPPVQQDGAPRPWNFGSIDGRSYVAVTCEIDPQDSYTIQRNDIDSYHHHLLHSHCERDRLLGAMSVVRWGNATVAAGNGRGGQTSSFNETLKQTEQRATLVKAIDGADSHLRDAENAAAAALHAFNPVQRIGPSFASKILAFLRPESCGVFDSRIVKNLLKLDAAIARSMAGPEITMALNQQGVIPLFTPEVTRTFNCWCYFLRCASKEQAVIDALRENYQCPIRAVDVERAVWSIFANATQDRA